MSKRYAIWNKQDPILTPVGKLLTAEEWMNRYPVARLENITVVCSAGEINGGYFGTLGQLVHTYGSMGANFSACTTDEEKLEVIEAFEEALNTPTSEVSTDERIAAALEAQVMLAMPDEDFIEDETV